MIAEFINLSGEESTLMIRTPSLIAVLIAGTDGLIDNREMEAARMYAHFKKITAREILEDYYKLVRKNFDEDIKTFIDQYPENSEERQQVIISELRKINGILPKLDQKFAIQFYASIKDFAKKIAESSGGFLGYLPKGFEESKLIKLEMIEEPA